MPINFIPMPGIVYDLIGATEKQGNSGRFDCSKIMLRAGTHPNQEYGSDQMFALATDCHQMCWVSWKKNPDIPVVSLPMVISVEEMKEAKTPTKYGYSLRIDGVYGLTGRQGNTVTIVDLSNECDTLPPIYNFLDYIAGPSCQKSEEPVSEYIVSPFRMAKVYKFLEKAGKRERIKSLRVIQLVDNYVLIKAVTYTDVCFGAIFKPGKAEE